MRAVQGAKASTSNALLDPMSSPSIIIQGTMEIQRCQGFHAASQLFRANFSVPKKKASAPPPPLDQEGARAPSPEEEVIGLSGQGHSMAAMMSGRRLVSAIQTTSSPRPMQFRPCIDLHRGKVKQIVGSTLSDLENRAAKKK